MTEDLNGYKGTVVDSTSFTLPNKDGSPSKVLNTFSDYIIISTTSR